MTFQMKGRRIAILGASGNMGIPLTRALIDKNAHTITAIQRLNATSSFPPEVIVKRGNLEDEVFLAEVLKEQDALVLIPPLSHLESLQKPAIRAAAKVGLAYVLPSEFGPDPFAGQLTRENALLLAKKEIRDYIEELGVSHWISITVGPWYDVNLNTGLWGIDPKFRTATIWRGADAKVNTATILHAAQATAAVLSLPEPDLARYKNKAVYTPSWTLTQREILNAVQSATGTSDSDWTITEREFSEVAEDYESKIKEGDGTAPYVKFFVTQFLEGHGGNFETKVDVAELAKLEQLGLQQEDLLEATKSALR